MNSTPSTGSPSDTMTGVGNRSGNRTIGLAEMIVSDVPGDVLVTYSLGSCVGVTLYDPDIHLGGMIHCMLPLSSQDPAKAQGKPCMFVDSGMAALLGEMYRLGARRERLLVKVAGAGNMLDPNHRFNIGERNFTVLRKVLWKINLMIAGEDVGGTTPRTLYLEIATGRTLIRSNGQCQEL